MLMACEILYRGKVGDLRRAVKKYLDDKNETVFLNTFIKGDVPKKTRYTMQITDSSDDTQKVILSFDEALSNVIEALSLKSPKSRNTLEKLQQLVRNKLHIDLDETQSGSTSQLEENTEAKTKDELRDINTANLYEHLKDIYGVGAYDIIRSLREKFDDDTTAVGYWNINTGELALKSNALLNRNIINLKNRYYKSIVQWLKSQFPNDPTIQNLQEGIVIKESKIAKRKNIKGETVEELIWVDKFIGSEYFKTMAKFYETIKSMDNFQELLQQDQINKIRNTKRQDKEKLYKQMINVLDSNDKFHKLISNKYNNRKYIEMLTNLYQADYLSEYYQEAKRLTEKFKLHELKVGDKTVAEIMEEIESDQLTLLEATNAYTSLTHFDELLKELHGNSFNIAQGTEGIEDGDLEKYSYHQDTAHEIKGWQTSEDIDSEKHIANLTKRVLNQIRVYDVKTGSYQNRRVDSTAYIVAARNLLNDIIYHNITWTKIPETGARREAFNNFIKTVALLHDDPEASFQKVLEYLFDTNNGNLDPYYKNMQSRKLLTDYDMDILYSVYLAVYDKDNANSLVSQELRNRQKDNGTVQNLVQEISGFVDRNTTMDYLETSYDFETGEVSVKVKKKFFNSRQLYKTRTTINTTVNAVTADRAIALRDKYNFQTLPAVNGKVYYEVTLPNGTTLTLSTPNIGGQILTNNGVSWQDNTIFMPLNNIDIITFKDKIMSGDVLTNDSEILLRDMLQFIDDHLGLGILTNPSFGLSLLQTYKTIYHPVEDKVLGKQFMMPLMQLAMRAAYANSRYAEANGKPLGQYLGSLDSDDGIYKAYTSNKKNKLFSEKYNNVKYTIATFNDQVLDQWTDAYSMLTGEASKATTKDKSGNSIPNNSVNKLGSMLHYYLLKQQDSNVSSLLFVENSNLIRSTFHDLEVTTWNNDTKSIKAFSGGELFFHSIFNKFWGNYLNTGNVIIQPTTYSDKTTFLNYEISTNFGNTKDILKSDNYSKEILEQYIATIGNMYKNVFNTTKNKLQQIADAYNASNNTNLSYKQVLKQINEDQLISLANSLSITLELDKDYRIIVNKDGKKVTAANEELEYYAEKVYKNTKTLENYINSEKSNFVQNLLESNSVFQVIDYGDDVNNYTDKKISQDATSKNTVINTIKQFFKDNPDGRQEFFKNWVDAKTGRLIIAKQGSENITGIGSDFNQNKAVILNPLLDRFFLLEGLLSNNLRMSLTGSEINHPNKAFDTLYNTAKEAKTKEELLDLVNIGKVPDSQLLEAFKVIQNSDYVGDLVNYTNPILQSIYEQSLLTISNVSQGTQFKRNVIIPATLQYCQQNVKDGITAKVKCAVIRDEKADVWNYRGDHEKAIDSADGNAKINPFQSILENKSLGSQAVGFVKKPIWHSYDSDSGTAFLAKFATDTITNELMRSSSHSATKLTNLFKKMTNLQWRGDVSLTQSLVQGELDSTMIDRWFKTTILGNTITQDSNGNDVYLSENRLIYEDRYGSATEIVGFGKTVSEGIDLYYTKEKPFFKKVSDSEKSEKVFHVFYDEQTPEGINESKHITFDTYQKAKAFIQQHPRAHSINSLYELHTALGGINCIDSNKKPSEFSNEVVVNFMNNVGYRKEGYTKNDIINQISYEQPLKKYHIGYALNNTAVKNGAKNINQASAWKDNSKLKYFEVDSSGLGMQMNADHDIVNSELTEFSQVVTATSAYGYTHDNCNEIFRGLASAALQASKKALDAVDNFLKQIDNKEQAQSDLYDAIGRIILINQSIKDKESLQNIIMEAVNKVFFKSKNHSQDSAKIPFSDANVYSDFIATLASTINKQSIKRKHPGSGSVIVPAYNMVQYFEIDGKKLMPNDILKKAREDYKAEIKELLTKIPGYNSETNAIEIEGQDIDFINNQPTKVLEELLTKYKADNTSRYYRPDIQDITEYNNFIISQYLEKMQLEARTFGDNTWFMPSDVVDIMKDNIRVGSPINLDSLEVYYKFKDGLFESELANGVIINTNYAKGYFDIKKNESTTRLQKVNNVYKLSDYSQVEVIQAAIDCMQIFDKITLAGEIQSENLVAVSDSYVNENGMLVRDYEKISSSNYGFTYRNNVTVPRNLKPSLIRWQYQEDENSPITYMNIFDVPVIRNAYIDPNNRPADYREQIQDILHHLHSGIGMDRFGNDHTIIEGSLENSAAELIMSNLYQDKFGIGEESLNDILEQGEKFFEKKYNKLNAPVNTIYDLAFIKDSGKHTLLTFGNVSVDGYVTEKFFDNSQLSTNEKDEIVLMKGNKELFEVGKWVNNPEGVIYKDGEFILNGKVLDKNKYRLKDQKDPTSIQKRIDYVTRYTVHDKMISRSGKTSYKASTLYKIADIKDFEEALGDKESADNQRASIVSKIYNADAYKLAQVNINKNLTEGKLDTIKSATGWMLGNYYIPQEVKDLLNTQLSSIETVDLSAEKTLLKQSRAKNRDVYKTKLQEFLKNEAHKKWISFLDSQNFIASRIPAQTLQSFMSMKLINWTSNSKNMAYVSHFQTYLQGSDYDIDKAYIMGQSYDDNAIYIKWSNLFDYTSLATLQASKMLPIPKQIEINNVEGGINLDSDINSLLVLLDNECNLFGEENQRVKALQLFSKILKQAENNNGQIYYSTPNPKFNKLLKVLNNHEFYHLPNNIAESAYKNVASANIYAVTHDIRNRDQAYTAISMDILQKAAKDSPKGNQSAKLNMLNPLTKYVMQYQNLVGKNVISIAANGEKVWFNAYYYWHKLLKEGKDVSRLKFSQTLNRIAGRASKEKIESKTVTHLPDLDIRDENVKNLLISEFNATRDSMEYVYVDQLISQLLSAATDNAKELILAKINAGTNFARMYVYAMMTGFNIDDIVAFMTSPAAEFIDQMSAANIFQNDSINNNAQSAINLAMGIISPSKFLHGTVLDYVEDPESGEFIKKPIIKSTYVRNILDNLDDSIIEQMKQQVKLKPEESFEGLKQQMQGLILTAIENRDINIAELSDTDDTEINSYLTYCQDIVEKLRIVNSKYKNTKDFTDDIQEFNKLYQLASEISTISSSWLGLNQGLPTDELSLLKRLMAMSKLVSDREKALGIKASEIYEKAEQKISEDEDEDWEELKTRKKSKSKVDYVNNKTNLLNRLLENNPTLINVEARLDAAYEAGIMNNFDQYKYLTDPEYAKQVKDYYGLIMGTLNVFEMMDEIPHYQAIKKCLTTLVVSNKTLASKSRLIDTLVAKSGTSSLSDQQLKGIIRYVDKLNTYNFVKGLNPIAVKESIEGFDSYFKNIKTNKIDLSTLQGMATFKHWIENEFLQYLRDNYGDNGVVKHLIITTENDSSLLSTDIDLLNPNVTTVSREGYDEILRGMADFEKADYDSEYKIASLLQLYNLIVNNNRYGSERLTTAFKVCSDPTNILNRYLGFISKQDYKIDDNIEYDYIDYLINSAPIVSTSAERFHSEKFIKVNDPVRGYVLKILGNDNKYRDYDMIPPVIGEETSEEKLRRWENFETNCSIQLPHQHNSQHLIRTIDYEGSFDKLSEEDQKQLKEDVMNLLKQFSISNKLLIYKDC